MKPRTPGTATLFAAVLAVSLIACRPESPVTTTQASSELQRVEPVDPTPTYFATPTALPPGMATPIPLDAPTPAPRSGPAATVGPLPTPLIFDDPWPFPTSEARPGGCGTGQVVYRAFNGRYVLVSVDANFVERWSSELPWSASVQIEADVLLTAGADSSDGGFVHAFEADTGQELWQVPFEQAVVDLRSSGGVAYVLSSDQLVSCD